MVNPQLQDELVRQLESLSPELQLRVLEFARKLVNSTPKRVVGKELLRFAGMLSPEDAKVMSEAIEAGCEKVDLSEW